MTKHATIFVMALSLISLSHSILASRSRNNARRIKEELFAFKDKAGDDILEEIEAILEDESDSYSAIAELENKNKSLTHMGSVESKLKLMFAANAGAPVARIQHLITATCPTN